MALNPVCDMSGNSFISFVDNLVRDLKKHLYSGLREKINKEK